MLDEDDEVVSDHTGKVESEPGPYPLEREFMHAFDSHTVGRDGRDAERIARPIASA